MTKLEHCGVDLLTGSDVDGVPTGVKPRFLLPTPNGSGSSTAPSAGRAPASIGEG